ncbi:MAG: ferritin [Anaerolineales bacterium]|nr:ferritin [Anaerolineales bacterium]
MMNEAVVSMINDQIEHEFFSAYLYLSMAAYFESKSLSGFARWMRLQADEEREHAMKFFDFLIDRGARVSLHAISQPQAEWTSVLDVFEHSLQHEQKVTSLINSIYEKAVQEKDYPTQVMLHWFIDEQVEEEKNVGQIVDMLRMAEDRQAALLNLDYHVGKRSE